MDVVDFANVMFCLRYAFGLEILGGNRAWGLTLLPIAELSVKCGIISVDIQQHIRLPNSGVKVKRRGKFWFRNLPSLLAGILAIQALLLSAQRDHRVDVGCAQGGDITGEQGDEEQHNEGRRRGLDLLSTLLRAAIQWRMRLPDHCGLVGS